MRSQPPICNPSLAAPASGRETTASITAEASTALAALAAGTGLWALALAVTLALIVPSALALRRASDAPLCAERVSA